LEKGLLGDGGISFRKLHFDLKTKTPNSKELGVLFEKKIRCLNWHSFVILF